VITIKDELRKRYCELMNKSRELYDQGKELSPEEQAEFRQLSLAWCDIQLDRDERWEKDMGRCWLNHYGDCIARIPEACLCAKEKFPVREKRGCINDGY
jgi:hypothetical protein